MTTDQIETLIKHHGTKCIRVYSNGGNLIVSEEGGTDNCLNILKKFKDVLSSYGTVEVWAGNTPTNWKSCNKWQLNYNNNTPTAHVGAVVQNSNPWDFFNQMPAELRGQIFGTNKNNDNELQLKLFEAKLEAIKIENDYKFKIHQLENSNPLEKYGGYAPLIMKTLGWKTEEIKETMGLMYTGKVKGSPAAVAEVKNVVDFNSVITNINSMDEANKNDKIEELLKKIPDKVSAEYMILLLEIFTNADEEFPMSFVHTCQKVGIEKTGKLLKALAAKPEFADTALQFINK